MHNFVNFIQKHALIVFILLLVGSRFFNLDNTARFTRDESSDLARIHEYWSAKKITLVGPISNDNVKVFSSLTYYMLMPFAIIGNFDPVSTAYGAAFWGFLTALLLLNLVIKINRPIFLKISLLVLIWYPLLESSRWAWNPHLMPFWFAVGFVFLLKPNPLTATFAGIFFGLASHNHYIALVTGLIYLLVQSWLWLRNKQLKFIVCLWLGFSVALLPFVLFDLRHPPGLFISGYIGNKTPHIQTISSIPSFLDMLWRNIYTSFYAIARQHIWAIIVLITSATLIVIDFITKKISNLVWLIPPAVLILAGVFLDGFETRYSFASIVFFFMWLIQKRLGVAYKAQCLLIGVLIFSSLYTSPKLLQKPQMQPSTRIIKAASNIVISTLATHPEIKNANITTDMSDDSDMLSLKYRDYLSIRGISFRAPSEYDISEHLFVITQANQSDLLASVSYPLLVFRNQKIRQIADVPNSNWKIYWFSY